MGWLKRKIIKWALHNRRHNSSVMVGVRNGQEALLVIQLDGGARVETVLSPDQCHLIADGLRDSAYMVESQGSKGPLEFGHCVVLEDGTILGNVADPDEPEGGEGKQGGRI